jgi:hypothetical protein
MAEKVDSSSHLFIEPGLCLQLLSDSTSRWTPLLSDNSSCCQAYDGLSPPSYRSCRAYRKRGHSGPCIQEVGCLIHWGVGHYSIAWAFARCLAFLKALPLVKQSADLDTL